MKKEITAGAANRCCRCYKSVYIEECYQIECCENLQEGCDSLCTSCYKSCLKCKKCKMASFYPKVYSFFPIINFLILYLILYRKNNIIFFIFNFLYSTLYALYIKLINGDDKHYFLLFSYCKFFIFCFLSIFEFSKIILFIIFFSDVVFFPFILFQI